MEPMQDIEVDAKDARKILVKPPPNQEVKKIIDKLAVFVSEDGHLFEEELMRRDLEDYPLLSFLSQKGSEEALYYRWKVFSLLFSQQNDTRIFKGGAVWKSSIDTIKK